MRGATGCTCGTGRGADHFYSHAPCGARQLLCLFRIRDKKFLLTRPMRGATRYSTRRSGSKCISTHTPHAGRDFLCAIALAIAYISAHTPHAGRDQTSPKRRGKSRNFYSHAPCGARHPGNTDLLAQKQFLLTRPMRGATGFVQRLARQQRFLLTRPMRGATFIQYFTYCTV